MSKITIKFNPSSWQQEALDLYNLPTTRILTLSCSRRSGKSFLSQYILIKEVLSNINYRVLYITPTYRLCKLFYKEICLKFKSLIKSTDAMDMSITFFNNSVIEFFSGTQPDNIRGRKYHRAVLDEAAYLSNYAIEECILPCMANVKDSKIILASSPKGKYGKFYEFFINTDDSFKSYKADYTKSPYIDDSFVKLMRNTLSERSFKQEMLAEFLEIGEGGLFKNILESITKGEITNKLYAGLDIGYKDSTVLTILNDKGEMVQQHVWSEVDFTLVVEEVGNILNDLNVSSCYVEQNGIGLPIIHLLSNKSKCVKSWVTSNKSKNEIIEALMIAFEKNEIGILDIAELINQLSVYEIQKTPKGGTTFNAPNGQHDDMVMSLAIAYKCFKDETDSKYYNVY